jgi:hypothetical protein
MTPATASGDGLEGFFAVRLHEEMGLNAANGDLVGAIQGARIASLRDAPCLAWWHHTKSEATKLRKQENIHVRGDECRPKSYGEP